MKESASEKRHTDLKTLYEDAFPAVARFIARAGGSLDEARDIFQDAVVIYYEKSADKTFAPETNARSYVFGIAKHLWLRRYDELKKHTSLEGLSSVPDSERPETSTARIRNFLAVAGRKCMELLSSYYYDNSSMSEIAGQFGFSGERSATVQKYKCLEKVRNTIKEKSLQYEDFLQ